MKFRPVKLVPALVAASVILAVSLVSCARPDFFERLERMTFDMRAREALRFSPSVATNLGFLYIDEQSIRRVWDGSLGYRFGLYWPRQVYGRVVQELALQHARSVAFDVIFGELRPDQPPVQMADGTLPDSDEYFAQAMKRASNVIIAVTQDVTPPALFLTNALAVGDISTDKDSFDGILRRARAFRTYRNWHFAFRQLEADSDMGVDLHKARVLPHKIVLPRYEGEDMVFPLDTQGNFDLADLAGTNLPPNLPRKAKPFTEQRVWHMGVVLAARELGLDLDHAEIDLPHGRITLRGPGGLKRVIPVDQDGWFFIDWCLPPNSPKLTRQAIQDVLAQYKRRLEGDTNDLVNYWAGKSVVVGSSSVLGNDLTDRGATPLEADTLLVSKHWNVANSVLTGRFIRRAPLGAELLLVALLGVIAALATWQMRALPALGVVALVAALYIGLAVGVYVQSRYWLPIVPVGGALLVQYVCQVTWRVVFEQAERRRVRSVFSTMVSPKIVTELLEAETLELGGVRREITVFFADVRGFTTLTDSSQERVAEFVRQNNLSGPAAEAAFDTQARETLATVNQYLGVIADTIIQHDGTLDKFIGDCVMAFWGAPTPNARHAVACVQAAVGAQRAIYELNCARKAENEKREAENAARLAAGLAALPMLPILFLGTGINTGVATVGLMGSASQTVVRQGSYTVFGREVNLASRLEGLSGRGHIFISESTYEHLRRDDPALAATCVSLPPVNVKGIRTAVQVYEVPWRTAGGPALEEEFAAPAPERTVLVNSGHKAEPS